MDQKELMQPIQAHAKFSTDRHEAGLIVRAQKFELVVKYSSITKPWRICQSAWYTGHKSHHDCVAEGSACATTSAILPSLTLRFYARNKRQAWCSIVTSLGLQKALRPHSFSFSSLVSDRYGAVCSINVIYYPAECLVCSAFSETVTVCHVNI